MTRRTDVLLADLPDTLRAAGCRVEVDPGFATRGQGQLAGVKAIMCHHTGSVSANTWKVVRDGRTGLQGLLSQLVLERDGLWRVLGSGQAWHAGTGGPLLGIPANSANSWTVGIEAVSAGTAKGDWTAEQLAEYPRGVAALCRRYGLTEQHVIFHKTWAPGRKIDLAGWPGDLTGFRGSVARHLTAPTAAPEDDMFTDQDRQLLRGAARAVDLAWTRDQLMTHLGFDPSAPPRPKEQWAGVEVARRADVGFALGELRKLLSVAAGSTDDGPRSLTDADVSRVAAAVLDLLAQRAAP
jgi:hypothetical protein